MVKIVSFAIGLHLYFGSSGTYAKAMIDQSTQDTFLGHPSGTNVH